MKRVRFVPTILVVAAVVGGLLSVAPATRPSSSPALRPVAEKYDPTGPAPIVPKPTIVPDACEDQRKKVKKAEENYNGANRVYMRFVAFGNAVSVEEVLLKEDAVLAAVRELNQANYDWAQCMLAAAKPGAVCDSVALELNRRAADVRVLQRRVAIAEWFVRTAVGVVQGENARKMLAAAKDALEPAQISLAAWRVLVIAIQRLGLCAGTDFGKVACSDAPSGGDQLALGGGLDEPTACAVASVPPSAAVDMDIDTLDEWLAAYEELCGADPDCGAIPASEDGPLPEETPMTGPGL